MRSVSYLLIALVAACAVSVASAAYASCYVTGDPHYRTWDNVRHDYQATGAFRLFKNPDIEVQALLQRCNRRARKPVTCIRSVTISLTSRPARGTAQTRIVKWGSFGSQPAFSASGNFPATAKQPTVVDDVVVHGGEPAITGCTSTTYNNECPVNVFAAAKVIGGGNMKLQYKHGKLYLYDQNSQTHLIIGRYRFYAHLDTSVASTVLSHGLCGKFGEGGSDDFTGSDSVNYLSTAKSGKRYNGNAVNNWGATWLVTGSIPALLDHSTVHLSGVPITVSSVTDLPTPASQAILNSVDISDVTQLSQLEAECQKNNPGDNFAFQDCVYDASSLLKTDPKAAMALGQSNNDAAVEASTIGGGTQDSSSDGLSGGETAAVVLGVVAGVALIVAGVMYIRLRKVRTETSRALTLVQQQNRNTGQNAGTTHGEMNLADNL